MRLSQTPPPQLADAAAGQGNRENELLFSQGLSLHGWLFSVGYALKELNRRELNACAAVLMHTSTTTHRCDGFFGGVFLVEKYSSFFRGRNVGVNV